MLTNDQTVLRTVLSQEKLEAGDGIKDDEFFERFCALEVLKQADPSDADVDGGIVDQGDDGGIDSMYVLLDGRVIDDVPEQATVRSRPNMELVVIQSKTGNNFSGNAVNKLNSIAPLLLNLGATLSDNSEILHSGVREIRDLFISTFLALAPHHPQLRISFYLCACADEDNVSVNVSGWADPIKNACREKITGSEVNVHFWGAKSLYESHAKIAPSSFTLKLIDSPISTTQGSYVALVPIGQLMGMVVDDDGDIRHYIFDSNVRDFYAGSDVNEEISQSSLSLDSLDFWWLNNGLTVLVSDMTYAAKSLSISNPQVVNGLQTSIALSHVRSRLAPDTLETKSVLVKFVKATGDSETDRIIKATNSQNNMPAAGLRALDPFQRQVEDRLKSAGLYYERRRNYYRARRQPVSRIVSMEYLGQALISMRLRRPNDARARPSSLLKDDTRYKSVFDPSTTIDAYLSCAQIGKSVDGFLSSVAELSSNDRTNIRFHVMMVAVDLTLGPATDGRRKLEAIDATSLDDDFLLACVQLIMEELTRLAEEGGLPDDRVAKGSELVVAITKAVALVT